MSEWVKWEGGDCPVKAEDMVDYRLRCGGIHERYRAGSLYWGYTGEGSDITAYRLTKTKQSREEAYEETERGIYPAIREFETGATRGAERGKLDYEGFLSPLVLERFAVYMDDHRTQADGNRRDSDNWQKGMPQESYIKSGWRHFMDWWKEHRGFKTGEGLENALCAVIFNAQGYLHEHLKRKEGK